MCAFTHSFSLPHTHTHSPANQTKHDPVLVVGSLKNVNLVSRPICCCCFLSIEMHRASAANQQPQHRPQRRRPQQLWQRGRGRQRLTYARHAVAGIRCWAHWRVTCAKSAISRRNMSVACADAAFTIISSCKITTITCTRACPRETLRAWRRRA